MKIAAIMVLESKKPKIMCMIKHLSSVTMKSNIAYNRSYGNIFVVNYFYNIKSIKNQENIYIAAKGGRFLPLAAPPPKEGGQ